MERIQDGVLLCSVCEQNYNHLIGTIQVIDDDSYNATKLIVSLKGKTYEIDANIQYEFRTQGNLSLLFLCESSHYHIFSFDGHKGTVFVNSNKLMDKISSALNKKIETSSNPNGYINHLTNYEVIAAIESEVNPSK